MEAVRQPGSLPPLMMTRAPAVLENRCLCFTYLLPASLCFMDFYITNSMSKCHFCNIWIYCSVLCSYHYFTVLYICFKGYLSIDNVFCRVQFYFGQYQLLWLVCLLFNIIFVLINLDFLLHVTFKVLRAVIQYILYVFLYCILVKSVLYSRILKLSR